MELSGLTLAVSPDAGTDTLDEKQDVPGCLIEGVSSVLMPLTELKSSQRATPVGAQPLRMMLNSRNLQTLVTSSERVGICLK